MPWLTFRLARRALAPLPPSTIDHRQLAINHSLPLIAAFLSAIYAYFVLYGAMVQTETFFICALLWSLERSLALAAALGAPQPAGSSFRMARPTLVAALTLGLSLGIATLLRQSILPWAPVLFVWLLFTAWVHSRQPAAQPSAGKNPRHLWLVPALLALFVAGLVLLASILPFTVRNYRAYGDFLLLNSNAGYAMYSAQHPLHGTDFQAYAAAPLPTDLNPIPQNEAQWDRVLMAHGIQFVLAEPGRYLLLSLSRVQDYLEFWPKDSSSFLFNLGRMLSFALLLPFMLYGIWLALRDETRRARAAGWGVFWTSGTIFLLLFALFYSVLHILTWAMPRYRLPVDAVLLIFAARGLADLAQRLATRRKSHHLPQSTQTSH